MYIHIGIGIGMSMDIDADMAVCKNSGVLEKGFRAPLKGFEVGVFS